MASLAYPTRTNGSSATTPRRSLLADFLGLEPFDFTNFSSPFVDAAGIRGGLEITRSENGYAVEIPVPGYTPDQIEVTMKDGVLTVSGKTERRSFTRSLALPEEIDPDTVAARVEHGMLTLNLSRRPEAQPKRIAINVN